MTINQRIRKAVRDIINHAIDAHGDHTQYMERLTRRLQKIAADAYSEGYRQGAVDEVAGRVNVSLVMGRREGIAPPSTELT